MNSALRKRIVLPTKVSRVKLIHWVLESSFLILKCVTSTLRSDEVMYKSDQHNTL